MEIFEQAPLGWDDTVRSAALLAGFTEAHQALGYQVYYLRSVHGYATFHVRGGRRLGGLFRRANVFCEAHTKDFAKELMHTARTLGIPLLRLGNSIYGLAAPLILDSRTVALRTRHTFVTDLTPDLETIVRQFSSARRRNIKKAERVGITVHLADSVDDMRLYSALSDETTQRIREHSYYKVYPLRFFTTFYDMLVPRVQAFCLLAKQNGYPLAGGFFTIKDGTAVYYHGCSTRQEGIGAQQAASLLFLRALAHAKAQGCKQFDWGGCSPHAPKNDSRFGVYHYKKGWGGELVAFYNADVWVNRPLAWLQEWFLVPTYERLRRSVPHFAERLY
jgi:hypothetical protein